MTSDPAWLEGLGKSEPAADVPREFIEAVRTRRKQRRMKVAGVSAACVVAACAVVVALAPWRGTSPKPRDLARAPETPGISAPVSPVTEDAVPSIASYYRAGMDDRAIAAALPVEAGGSSGQSLRIGDHWDPERVAAWVLD